MNDPTPYEVIIRHRFAGVRVRLDPAAGASVDMPVLDAFLVPDARAAEFVRFARREFRSLIEKAGLPAALVVTHTESATREHYPDVWEERQALNWIGEWTRFPAAQPSSPRHWRAPAHSAEIRVRMSFRGSARMAPMVLGARFAPSAKLGQVARHTYTLAS